MYTISFQGLTIYVFNLNLLNLRNVGIVNFTYDYKSINCDN